MKSQIDALHSWRRIHKSYILGYFAKHFGSGQVPGLELVPAGREETRIAMTNFYILTQTKINGVPLIDRNNPEESLLIQWGLPREEAKFAAPKNLQRWESYYKDPKDERFVNMVKWIESLVAVNQGSTYDLNYKFKKNDKKTPPAE